ARDLIGRCGRCRFGVQEKAQQVQARRLVLAGDELTAAGAAAPVDSPQRVAAPVFADPEDLAAGSGPGRSQAGLELAHPWGIAEGREEWQGQADLAPARDADFAVEAQVIAGFERPAL